MKLLAMKFGDFLKNGHAGFFGLNNNLLDWAVVFKIVLFLKLYFGWQGPKGIGNSEGLHCYRSHMFYMHD
jgi:hypothetical protein